MKSQQSFFAALGFGALHSVSVAAQTAPVCNPPCGVGQQCMNGVCMTPAPVTPVPVPPPAQAPQPGPVQPYGSQPAPPPAYSPTPQPQGYAPQPAPPPAYGTAQPAYGAAPQPAYGAAPQPSPQGYAPQPQPPYGSAPPAQYPQGPGVPVPGADVVPAASTGAPGVHRHDGFYLRMGIGIGGSSYAGNLSSKDQVSDGAGIDGKGVAIPVELSIGWTIAPGLVLGPGIFGASTLAPSDRAKNYGVTLESDGGPMIMSSLGPFADYYFDPEKGLHAQGGIALARVTAAKGKDPNAIPDQDYSGIGWSAMLGFGWETWIGEQWSAGILGRVQYGHASLDASQGNNSVSLSFLLPTVLATFTYH